MPTLALLLSYDGAPFHGFARQKGGLHTVQGDVEAALETVFRRPIDVTCAGRTDAGVHALGQVVSFDVADVELEGRTMAGLRRSLDALCDPAIAVRSAAVAPPGFSARFDALWREYRYFFSVSPARPLIMRDFCWHVPGVVDVDAMSRAAAALVGEHDFKSFCVAASAEGKSTVRTVISADVAPCEVAGEQLLCLRIVGQAFLHSMVRTIAGSLMAIGRGQRPVSWMAEALAACDRAAAGAKAPAGGLVLWHVEYDGLRFPTGENDAKGDGRNDDGTR